MTTPLSIDQVIVIWFLFCFFSLVTLKYVREYIGMKKEQESFYTRKTEGHDKLKEEEEDRYRGRIFSSDIH